MLLRQVLPRCLDVELVVLRERLDQLEVIGVAPIPAANRAAGEREVRVMHDARRIEELLARPGHRASWAGARRVVEGKQPRLEFGDAVAADRAGELVGEHQLRAVLVVHERDARHAVGESQRRLE